MYADAARLLVFGAFLTSASCVKKYFFDATETQGGAQSTSLCFISQTAGNQLFKLPMGGGNAFSHILPVDEASVGPFAQNVIHLLGG